MVGAYDTIFEFECEEWDWQARAKLAGFKIFYTPYAKIWHKIGMTIGKKSAFKAYYDVMNPLIVISRYKDSTYLHRFIINHFWHYVIKASIRAVIVDLDLIKFFKIWLGFFRGIIKIKTYSK
jgi:GT2 family glycosyltransferase